MKKLYVLFVLTAVANVVGAQLYEGFNYTAGQNVGGTCNPAPCSNNNWTTHLASNAGTIDVLSGSLNYAGLLASSGNRIYIPGNNATTTRDINTPTLINGTPAIAYYSFLINVVNNTQLSTGYNQSNYFISFGTTAGNSVGVEFARVGAISVNGGANFRLGVHNGAGGGTPTFSEQAVDLNFGTTYLVVVKYEIRTVGNDIATIWVNPASLGGTEPAGGASNNSVGGITVNTFGSIVITNTAGTPNAEIDEIRTGTTWASVTPDNSTLPVSLIHFKAVKESKGVRLAWKTADEVNTSHFEIERSKNGINYTSLARLNSFNTSGEHDYESLDAAPGSGVNYYRLKMADRNGLFRYSGVVKINLTKQGQFTVTPNPAFGFIVVESDQNFESIRIADMTGKLVQTFLPSASNRYDISRLPKGLYILQLVTEEGTEQKKIMVQ
jgi:hypothetical protein